MLLHSILYSIFYIQDSREQFHIDPKYRFYSKNKLKVYPKSCLGVPPIEPQSLKYGMNEFKVIKKPIDPSFQFSGKCNWWIADRTNLNNYMYLMEQDCLLGDIVRIDLIKDKILCTECILRLNLIIEQNGEFDEWYDSCIDFIIN
eukprot:NODE_1188_length_1864_cov_0.584703.p2 type:complete len:145 gc:universal NODE_1188_length_1864_cov_0.584703:576-142(-)